MARTVTDAAILLAAMVGIDPLDDITRESPSPAHADYALSLDRGGLSGARIGIARNFFGFHEKVDALMEEAIQAMRSEGASIIDPADVPNKDEINNPELEVLL